MGPFDEEADAIIRLSGALPVVTVDPDVAEAMGAFEETALDPDDALDSLFDDEEKREETSDD